MGASFSCGRPLRAISPCDSKGTYIHTLYRELYINVYRSIVKHVTAQVYIHIYIYVYIYTHIILCVPGSGVADMMPKVENQVEKIMKNCMQTRCT